MIKKEKKIFRKMFIVTDLVSLKETKTITKLICSWCHQSIYWGLGLSELFILNTEDTVNYTSFIVSISTKISNSARATCKLKEC